METSLIPRSFDFQRIGRLRRSACALLSCLLVSPAALAQPSQTPLEAAFAVQPNVMILLDNSGSMSSNSLYDTDGSWRTRFQVAKNAITDLIEETENVRFCLAVFRGAYNSGGWQADGADMSDEMQCTSSASGLAALVETIDDLPVITASTQLAEAYYDVTRYFRGQNPYFGDFDSNYDSPIQHRCQTNSVIVVSDGEPQLDWDRKNKDHLSINTGESGTFDGEARSLPNWDNIPPNSSNPSPLNNRDPSTGKFPPYSDGSCGIGVGCDGGASSTSYRLFVDDLALFANHWDMRSDMGSPGDFEVQDLKTHTIGFEIDVQMLQDAAEYGDGYYVEATSSTELVDALQAAIVTSLERQGSGAGATQSEIALDADGRTYLYFSQYDTSDWSGDLLKVELEEQEDHTLEANLIWSAGAQLDAMTDPVADRRIFTPNEALDGLVDLKSDGETTSMTDPLLHMINRRTTSSGEYLNAKRIVDYSRGDTSRYRARSTLMGDLVHSRPTFVKDRNYGYIDDDYGTYVLNNANRKAMIYVGANDGMLHAFDEQTGEEVFAFVPQSILPYLNKYRQNAYTENHLYMVDGEFSIVDAKLDTGSQLEWRTVLASPLGAGRIGMFMLDVTDPAASESDLRDDLFMWEIDNTTRNDGARVFKRMGYMLNPPKIVRFRIPEADNGYHDKWVLITGNGVHSKFGDLGQTIIGAATVMVIDLDTGELITEMVVDNGFVDQVRATSGTAAYTTYPDGNGVTSVAAVDTDADTYIERIYAADIKGNLWRFNYDENGTVDSDDHRYIRDNLSVAYEQAGGIPGPIFQATGPQHPLPGSGSYIQPISAELTVTSAPKSSGSTTGEMVFFGTGQFYDFVHLLPDVNNKVQTFYAFWDKGGWDSNSSPATRADLQSQAIVQSTVDGEQVRTLPSPSAINYTSQLGWYMDLPEPGERITRKSVGLFEHMAFFTQSPISGDPCVEGIDGWAMIAKKDAATPIAVTLATGGGNTTSYLGTKHTGDSIHDPIFVELSDGQFVAPVVIDAAGETPTVENVVHIQKDYSRASWKRLELN